MHVTSAYSSLSCKGQVIIPSSEHSLSPTSDNFRKYVAIIWATVGTDQVERRLSQTQKECQKYLLWPISSVT